MRNLIRNMAQLTIQHTLPVQVLLIRREPTVSVARNIINSPTYVQNESREWMHNTDKDISAYLNLHYNVKILGRQAIFSAGGMFRHKTRDNFNDSYNLPNTIVDGANESIRQYRMQNLCLPGLILLIQEFITATDPGIYTFTENIQGAYAMVKYYITRSFGFDSRIKENILIKAITRNLPVTFPGKTATITYADYLFPALILK